jgi:RNA polymerase sigma factor (sigma-70 family)
MDLTSTQEAGCGSVCRCELGRDESLSPNDAGDAEARRATPRATISATTEEQLAALVLRLCDQHQPSLARLYEATARRVYALVQRIVSAAPLAEEVVEDVFWQAWREAPRFDPERGNVLAWLLTMARSRAIDASRRQRRSLANETLLSDEALDTLPSALGEALDPSDLLDAARDHARLHDALSRLDPLPRQLLALTFLRGLTHEEVAQQTGLALGTVKSHVRRTLARLRAELTASA